MWMAPPFSFDTDFWNSQENILIEYFTSYWFSMQIDPPFLAAEFESKRQKFISITPVGFWI